MKNSIILDFKGVELEFFYGLSFLGEFLEKENLDITELNEKITSKSLSFIPKLMFESYLHNCQRKQIKPSITKLKLIDLIEQTNYFKDDSVAGEFIKAFYKSVFVTFGLEENKTDEPNEKKN